MTLEMIKKEMLKHDVLKMVEKTLDYAEVMIINKEQYKVFRKKLLRWGNDLTRRIDTIDQFHLNEEPMSILSQEEDDYHGKEDDF